MSAQHPVKSRAQELLNRAATKATHTARRTLQRATGPTVAPEPGRTPDGAPIANVRRPAGGIHLTPGMALRENGFAVFRSRFSADECASLAAALKREAGITDAVKYTKVDATNSFGTARELLLEGRILECVRTALSPDAKFLQVGDLHYLHDTAGWHRDSVHRAPDASDAPDWRDADSPFGVVKAILYLETQNAAMGIMPGSHLSPIAMDAQHVKGVEAGNGQLIIDSTVEPNQRFGDSEMRLPFAWQAEIGDVLVFDERMYHAGRRIDGGRVTANREAPKFTLSMVFGLDNHHSERMYAYFRYARKELRYRDLPEDFRAELADRDLVLSRGWGNFYTEHPQELRFVHLPDPAQLEPLIAEFAAPGSTSIG